MRLIIASLALLLTGCIGSIPIQPPKWPDAPTELREKCPDLNTANPDQPSITELLKTVVKNYELYYYCSLKQEGWNDWYNKHKKNYEGAFKK